MASVRLALAASMLLAAAAADAQNLDQLRGPAPLSEEAAPPRMAPVENRDLRRARSYPEQPPTIPHAIDGYRIDLNSNKCLSCHSRVAVAQSQAPMVSITHFMDRHGQFLAAVSPRRYFCNQCHVPQLEVEPIVGNQFEDIDTVLTRAAEPR
jgi:nitrate reductase (cytochrome), electron transfer subunit